jgi:hypothetical protein
VKRSTATAENGRAGIGAAVLSPVAKRRPLRWFVPMPARMALDPGLSNAAFRLATLLLHYEGDRGCFPSQSRLATDLGISLDSVQRYLRELELYGFLAREKRRGVANRYQLAPVYEQPIRHGSIEETGGLEIENAPRRRPPAPRDLRVRKAPAPTPKLTAPASMKDARARRTEAPVNGVAAPVRLEDDSHEIPVAASMRLPHESKADVVAASLRPAQAANHPSNEPHTCGPTKIVLKEKPPHQVPIRSVGGDGGELIDMGDGTEKNAPPTPASHAEQVRPVAAILQTDSPPLEHGAPVSRRSGIAALQRAGVNVDTRDIGTHLGRNRKLDDEELLAWGSWVATTAAPGILNKAGFAAAKIRMGCTLEDVFPAIAAQSRRREETRASAVAAAIAERTGRERAAQADELLAILPRDERIKLREQALDDGGVWLARGASRSLLERIILATERRLVLREIQPATVARDHSAYPELPPL